MKLADSLIKKFATIVNEDNTEKTNDTYFGTTVVDSTGTYVKLDGSTELTPVSLATDAKANDRVIVSIIDHKARVTINLTNPASGYSASDLYDEVTETGILAASKIFADTLDIHGKATADSISVNSLSSLSSNLGTITAGSININNKFTVDAEGNMTAINGYFAGELSASTIAGYVSHVTCEQLEGSMIKGKTFVASDSVVNANEPNIIITGDQIKFRNGEDLVDQLYTGGGSLHLGMIQTNGAFYLEGTASVYITSDTSQGGKFGIDLDGGYVNLTSHGGGINLNGSTTLSSNLSVSGKTYLNGDIPSLITSSGTLGHKNDSTKANLRISSSGVFGVINSGSSRRWKNSIKDVVDESLNPEKLYQINVRQFKYNTDFFDIKTSARYDTDVIGLIAEELDEIYPVAVDHGTDDNGNITCDDWSERYLIPPMIQLIQNQKKQIDSLETRLSALETRLSALESK